MSKRITYALLVSALLAGCDGNPFAEGGLGVGDGTDGGGTVGGGGGGGGGGTAYEIPEALRGNVQSIAYNPTGGAGGNGTLTAVIKPLDASPITATFSRSAALDTPGFKAFTFQETSSNRLYLALLSSSADQSVTAGVIGSGQFTEMVWGVNYAGSGFSAPSSGGLANYSGNYAGVLNTGVPVPGPGAPFDPIRVFRVSGDVLVNADFTDSSVEGGIRNRVADGIGPLEDLFLTITTIAPDGTFGGTVEYSDTSEAGTYGGVFGGNGATAVAGGIEVQPDPNDSDLLERGVFVADVCVAGDPPPCP